MFSDCADKLFTSSVWSSEISNSDLSAVLQCVIMLVKFFGHVSRSGCGAILPGEIMKPTALYPMCSRNAPSCSGCPPQTFALARQSSPP